MNDFHISFMENFDLQKSAEVLSLAMLDNPLHIAVFQGNGEAQRMQIEQMFHELFVQLPGIVFVAREKQEIIGVMRMKSCSGRKAIDAPKASPKASPKDSPKASNDKNDIKWRKQIWLNEWATNEPEGQHWHLGPIGVLPSHCGMGVGTQLMQRFCMEVDRCASPSYLETDLDQNVDFYQKFGFNVIHASTIFGVENRYMFRDSQS